MLLYPLKKINNFTCLQWFVKDGDVFCLEIEVDRGVNKTSV